MDAVQKTLLVKEVADSFGNACIKELSGRLESLYLVGSYSFNKISLDRPDLNFLFVFKDSATSDDYLSVGEVCRHIVADYKNKCAVRIEFRPFRYIYPKMKGDYEVFINPILTDVNEVKARGMIFTKWFTSGMKSSNKLMFGSDFLSTVSVGRITKKDVLQGALFDLPFFTIPLARAPAQYSDDESDLLFNESLSEAKQICYLGLEVAMTDEELERKEFDKYIKNKELISRFYKERYDEKAANLVTLILDARNHYTEYKSDRFRAKEMFSAALNLAALVQDKLFAK